MRLPERRRRTLPSLLLSLRSAFAKLVLVFEEDKRFWKAAAVLDQNARDGLRAKGLMAVPQLTWFECCQTPSTSVASLNTVKNYF